VRLRERAGLGIDFVNVFSPIVFGTVTLLCGCTDSDDFSWCRFAWIAVGFVGWALSMRDRDRRQQAIGARDFNAALEVLAERHSRGDPRVFSEIHRVQDLCRRMSWTTDRRGAGPR
jgi:hypothetical protein